MSKKSIRNIVKQNKIQINKFKTEYKKVRKENKKRSRRFRKALKVVSRNGFKDQEIMADYLEAFRQKKEIEKQLEEHVQRMLQLFGTMLSQDMGHLTPEQKDKLLSLFLLL